jgi:hypothetical protein
MPWGAPPVRTGNGPRPGAWSARRRSCSRHRAPRTTRRNGAGCLCGCAAFAASTPPTRARPGTARAATRIRSRPELSPPTGLARRASSWASRTNTASGSLTICRQVTRITRTPAAASSASRRRSPSILRHALCRARTGRRGRDHRNPIATLAGRDGIDGLTMLLPNDGCEGALAFMASVRLSSWGALKYLNGLVLSWTSAAFRLCTAPLAGPTDRALRSRAAKTSVRVSRGLLTHLERAMP